MTQTTMTQLQQDNDDFDKYGLTVSEMSAVLQERHSFTDEQMEFVSKLVRVWFDAGMPNLTEIKH